MASFQHYGVFISQNESISATFKVQNTFIYKEWAIMVWDS